jgi:DNA-binding GntR family transcriptional regulator
MRADAVVLAARSGLSVSAVHLALNELAAHRWIRIHSEIGPRIASPAPEVFLGISAGPWSARSQRGH